MSTERPETNHDRYRAAWRGVGGATGYLLASFFTSILTFSVLWTVFSVGLSLAVLVTGIPIMAFALHLARGFGATERGMLRWTGLPAIEPPVWPDTTGQSTWRRSLTLLGSPHHWGHLLHGLLVGLTVSTVTFSVTVTWWAMTFGGMTYWFWQGFLPAREPASDWPGWLAAHVWYLQGFSSSAVEIGIYSVAGVLFGVTLPWVIKGLARMQYHISAAMLGRWPSDDLRAQAALEAAGRQSAVHAEDSAMRRLERDLHDGPQQRLVRLQMDLATVERRAASGDAEQAVEVAKQAQLQAKAALDELRALSRGVAPPLLADRGLRAALAALAEESAVPVHARLDPAIDAAVSSDVARAVYFIAAELLTNVAKHAQASSAQLVVEVAPTAPSRLLLSVSDDGRGGAELRTGHGLSGLDERVRGLLGELTVESPSGGPTRVSVTLPLADVVAAWSPYPEA
jgi:signal transduction histidine kinase